MLVILAAKILADNLLFCSTWFSTFGLLLSCALRLSSKQQRRLKIYMNHSTVLLLCKLLVPSISKFLLLWLKFRKVFKKKNLIHSKRPRNRIMCIFSFWAASRFADLSDLQLLASTLTHSLFTHILPVFLLLLKMEIYLACVLWDKL